MNLHSTIELLERLIQTPSVSRDEAKVADIIADEFSRLGFEPRRVGNNVWTEAWAHDTE